MAKIEYLEQRLDEWARWCHRGKVVPGLNYSPVSAGFSEYTKQELMPVTCDDRELSIERAVVGLALIDKVAAEVIRAEYHAKPKYGHADYQDNGNNQLKTHKQIGISERTYRTKLDKAKAAVWGAIYK